jgi:hypothetical protein
VQHLVEREAQHEEEQQEPSVSETGHGVVHGPFSLSRARR